MTALLVYRNSTPQVAAWATDIRARTAAVGEARAAWMDTIYDAAGVPNDEKVRGSFVRDAEFSGLSWPDDVAIPVHWFRPKATPQLIRPKATRPGKAIAAQMRAFDWPDPRKELEQFGMPYVVFHGVGMYRAGVRYADDGVWVTWGAKELAEQVEAKGALGEHGWERVPIVQFIERFGEDEL